MHVNRQVREAVKEALDGLTSLASVSTNRSTDLLDEHLPAAIIGTSSDEVAEESKGGHERRVILLAVTIAADGLAQGLDDDLDAIRAEIETALAGDLGGLAMRVEHTGGELDMGTDEDGERWFAFLTLTWDVEVWTETGDPETAL
ncbi:MAG TPA: hypothetical protein VK966_04595 [Longimicrobiales bacterium]|nr:hypothetical protein [Longimicrobiales bacterium]